MPTPRLLMAAFAAIIILPSLAHADYYNNEHVDSSERVPSHYALQHHNAHQPESVPNAYTEDTRTVRQAPVNAHLHGNNQYSQYHATQPSAPPHPAPAFPAEPMPMGHDSALHHAGNTLNYGTAGPDDFTGGARYGAKVDHAAEQYKSAHPDLFNAQQASEVSPHMTQQTHVSEGARFSSPPTRELKLVDQHTAAKASSPSVKSHARHTSLFSNVKTMRPFDANWSSTYLH